MRKEPTASACNLSWRACTVAISMMLLAASAFKAQAQTPTLRIKVAVEAASAGIVLFESQGQNAVLTVTATDASGKPVNLGSFSPQWAVDNPDVVSLYGSDKGVTTRIVAQQDGHAIVTVTALGQTATQRVAVGKARLELSAKDVLPEFRVARLEISGNPPADPANEDDKLAGRALLLGENGHSIVLRARAFNSSGKPIPLISLPVAWSTEDADVMALDGESYEEVRVIGRNGGETTVTATLQGVTVTLQGYVGDARSNTNPALLAEKAVAEGTQTVALQPVLESPRVNNSVPLRQSEVGTVIASPVQPQPATRAGSMVSSQQPGTAPGVRAGTTAPAAAQGRTSSRPLQAGTGPSAAAASAYRTERIGASGISRGGDAVSRQANDPPAVHATGFKAISGYGMNVLIWKPAPGAAGYRLSRASWDPVKLAFIQGSEVEIPKDRPVDSAGLIRDTTFTDRSVTPGTYYVYWLESNFISASGDFYFPTSTQYPGGTVTTRDPAGMTWLPSEAERASAPTLVQVVPSATGLFIEWVPKGGVVGYVIMRTRKDPPAALQSYDKCYPYIIEFGGLVRHSNSVNLASFNLESSGEPLVKRFCVGIFAIYPETLIDGTPATYEFNNFNPAAYLKHHSMLESSVHSKGTFIWAEWDDSSGKWRLLPQGSFQIDPCITGSYATATVACYRY